MSASGKSSNRHYEESRNRSRGYDGYYVSAPRRVVAPPVPVVRRPKEPTPVSVLVAGALVALAVAGLTHRNR